MALWEQSWIWQVAVSIVGAIAVSALFYYLSHREKVEIKYPNLLVQLKTNEATGIKFEYSFSLIYMRGARDYYVSEIWVKFDKRSWKKLWPYFKIPLRISKLVGRDDLSKLEMGKLKHFGYDDFFSCAEGDG